MCLLTGVHFKLLSAIFCYVTSNGGQVMSYFETDAHFINVNTTFVFFFYQ